jgi:hypothetical protein
MPHVDVPGTDSGCELIAFDAPGVERTDDPNGVLMSQRVLDLAAAGPVSAVFLMNHGWQGDIPQARANYDAWVG